MVLRRRLQPEMAQGSDAQRGLVAYRYAIDRVVPRRRNSLLRTISPIWLFVVLLRVRVNWVQSS